MSDISIRHGGEIAPDEIRLYICHDCKSITPLDGEVPIDYRRDYMLHKVEAEHGGPGTEAVAEQISQRIFRRKWEGLPPLGRGHEFSVIAVTKAGWDNPQQQPKVVASIKQAIKDGGGAGFGADFYSVIDQNKEDAMTCWKAHNRTMNCDDFKTEKMVLTPDTKAMRHSEGLSDYRSNIHVCNFCPVGSLVEQQLRKKKFGIK